MTDPNRAVTVIITIKDGIIEEDSKAGSKEGIITDLNADRITEAVLEGFQDHTECFAKGL